MPRNPVTLDRVRMLVPPLLEVAQAAHRLNTNQRFVWRMIREGKLPAVWLESRWRIKPEDLTAFIEARYTAHQTPGDDRRPTDRRVGAPPRDDEGKVLALPIAPKVKRA